MKSYIIYKGGQYGDLVFSIVNNGVHLPSWVQHKLKNNDAVDDLKFKSFIDRLPIETITGCAYYPLDWGVNNYELVFTDKSINAFSVTRLMKLNTDVNLKNVLKSYYDDNVKGFVDKLTEEHATELLIKKYQTYIVNPKIPTANLIDINCIYDKIKFINKLSEYFNFDTDLAELQYDQWYERELPLLDKFFKTV
jgi:hypothetical protein